MFPERGRRGETQHSFKGAITSQLSFSFWAGKWMALNKPSKMSAPPLASALGGTAERDGRNLDEFQRPGYRRSHRTCTEFGSYAEYHE